jgi:hypothetical protein
MITVTVLHLFSFLISSLQFFFFFFLIRKTLYKIINMAIHVAIIMLIIEQLNLIVANACSSIT